MRVTTSHGMGGIIWSDFYGRPRRVRGFETSAFGDLGLEASEIDAFVDELTALANQLGLGGASTSGDAFNAFVVQASARLNAALPEQQDRFAIIEIMRARGTISPAAADAVNAKTSNTPISTGPGKVMIAAGLGMLAGALYYLFRG